MKANYFVWLAALLFYTVSCGGSSGGNGSRNSDIDTSIMADNSPSDSIVPGKLVAHVVCQGDASQSYAVYIPQHGATEKLPVIYFFDPHGDGSLPLEKYAALAETQHIILVGSNNSKNGNEWSMTETIWNTLTDDTKRRLPIDTSRVYAGGFSGGAKVAIYAGLNHHDVKGVIANGAAIADVATAPGVSFTFTAIAGRGDMNMTDLVSLNTALDKTPVKHRIIYFDGIHEWAPENAMRIAFYGLQLDAMINKTLPLNQPLIMDVADSMKRRVQSALATNNYVVARENCVLSVDIMDGLSSAVDWFKTEDAAIGGNPAYQKQEQAAEELLKTEQDIKTVFNQELQAGDKTYWMKAIKDVQNKAHAKSAAGAMYQRLEAYLSLAFYSISNQLINGNKNSDAGYFVDLYKIADPTNSEAWYFSAVLDARSQNAKATEEDLIKAVSYGFEDKKRLLQQPEFQQLGAQINLTAIAAKMK